MQSMLKVVQNNLSKLNILHLIRLFNFYNFHFKALPGESGAQLVTSFLILN